MKILRIGLCLSIVIFCSTNASTAQSYQGQRNQILAYNVLSNGLMGGIGGLIHKKKGQKALPTFFKNFGKGCLGGLIKYSAKNQTYYLRNPQTQFLAPMNRAFFFLGQSITMNASMNQSTLENYNCNFYGIDFQYSPYQTKGKRLDAKVSLGSVAALINFTAAGHKMDFYKSLEFGQFYFDIDPEYTLRNGNKVGGLGSYNVFGVTKYSNGSNVRAVPHEVLHSFQNYDFFAISNFYEPNLTNELNKFKAYKFLSKYINFDYQPLFYRALYVTQPKPVHYKNFFEFEAEHFSSRRFVLR